MGRGLSAILPSSTAREEVGLRDIPVDLIDPNPSQPRREFDEEALLGLSKSIELRGVLQPLVVRPLPGGRYELIAGERRLRAAKLADVDNVPAIVRPAEESERLELALIENMAREDLNPIDEARACARLVEALGLTKEEVARRVGRSRVAVSNLIRMLELPDEAIAMIERGDLSGGHGRALLLRKAHGDRLHLAREAKLAGWSVREPERRARDAEDGPTQRRQRRAPVVVHPDLEEAIAAAEDALSAALGREVTVRSKGDSFRVEFEVDNPREGVDLAQRILRRAAA